MSDNKLKSILIGLLKVPLADVERVTQREYTYITDKAAVAAGTDLVERCVFRARRPCMITGVNGMSFAAMTAHDTNYFAFIANKRTAADPATAVQFLNALLKLTGGTGSWVAFTRKDLSGSFDATVSKRILAAGDTVWVKTTNAGAGLQCEITNLTFEVEELSD